MFLSLCTLENLKPLDYYQLHKDLWRFFPNFDSSGLQKSPFFYRVENPHEKSHKKILLQSIAKPICNDLDSQRFKIDLKQTKDLISPLNDLKINQELRFFIRAYPSKKLKKDGKSSNRGEVRVPLRKDIENHLTKDDVMVNWLQKMMEKGNFVSVINCQVVESFPLRFKKRQKDGQYHFGTIYTVTFKGYLKVLQPKGFIENIVIPGIGPGKAFGCGMLSIAKS